MKELVYCCNCQHLCDESDLCFYTSINFRDDNQNSIKKGTYICKSRIEINIKFENRYFAPVKIKNIIVDNCSKLNKTNDCNYFKPKLSYKIKKFIKQLIKMFNILARV